MDNRRVYRTIRMALKQLFPTEPKGNFARRLTTLAALVSGIVQARSCQLPAIARKTPDATKADSRIKRYSRWVQHDKVEQEAFYLPFVRELLAHLAAIRADAHSWLLFLPGQEHFPAYAIHGDDLPVADAAGGDTGAHHRRQPKFARHD